MTLLRRHRRQYCVVVAPGGLKNAQKRTFDLVLLCAPESFPKYRYLWSARSSPREDVARIHEVRAHPCDVSAIYCWSRKSERREENRLFSSKKLTAARTKESCVANGGCGETAHRATRARGRATAPLIQQEWRSAKRAQLLHDARTERMQRENERAGLTV
jgi:hypothetical protein